MGHNLGHENHKSDFDVSKSFFKSISTKMRFISGTLSLILLICISNQVISTPIFCKTGDDWTELHIAAGEDVSHQFDGVSKNLQLSCFGGKIWDLASGHPKYKLLLQASFPESNVLQSWDLTNFVNKTALSYSMTKYVHWQLTFINLNSIWNADLDLTINWAATSNPDLSLSGFPHCMQICEEWCWATALAQVRDFLSGQAAQCIKDECSIVSAMWGVNCCNTSISNALTPKDCSGKCASAANENQIFAATKYLMPNLNWQFGGILDEGSVQDVLADGNPVIVLVIWTTGKKETN